MARCCPLRVSAEVASDGGGLPAVPLEAYCDALDVVGGADDATPMFFPMYVVRVPDLLRMTEAQPHQVLRAAGTLKEYDRSSMGVAAFVSHQWCSRTHPDPGFAQLAVLQAVLQRLAAGDMHLQVTLASWFLFKTKPTISKKALQSLAEGCVWYDYFAVPQPGHPGGGAAETQRHFEEAVSSIPAYVEACQYFIVLAPPLPHADFPECMVDYRSWRERGWCRLERLARRCSPPGRRHILLVTKDDTLFEMGCEDMDPVGCGAFSLDDDRARLAPVVVALMERRLQALLRQRDLHEYRRWLCTRAQMLRGLPGVSAKQVLPPGYRAAAGGQPLEAFLHLYGFRGPHDRAGGETSPIFFAARQGDVEAVQALLDSRASVNARDDASIPDWVWVRGSTPLHFASVIPTDPAVAALLLERRADVEAPNGRGTPPLMSAVCAGHRDIVATLLAHKASVGFRARSGITALHAAAAWGRSEMCAQLLQAGASAAPSPQAMSPLFFAVLLNAGRPTVEALLAAPDADLDTPWSPRRCSPMAVLLSTLALRHRLCGCRDHVARLACEMTGITPLMAAGFMGSIGEARALIAAGASPRARNSRGRTAADLAELAGLLPVAVGCLKDSDDDSTLKLPSFRATPSGTLVALQAAAVVDADGRVLGPVDADESSFEFNLN